VRQTTSPDDRIETKAKCHARWLMARRSWYRKTIEPEVLRAARKRAELTIAAAARRFGVSEHTWALWENGYDYPASRRISALRLWAERHLTHEKGDASA
jgi:DNA-binding transcriptional regulator YiaG